MSEVRDNETNTKIIYIPCYNGSLLKGKTVLITGGGSGIGFAIATCCLQNSGNVIICGRNLEKLLDAKTKLSMISSNIEIYKLDIADTDKMDTNFSKILEETKFKEIDILVNNAGVMIGKKFPNTSSEDYDKVLDINLKGTYFMSQTFAKYLVNNNIRGNILNVCSSSSNRPAIGTYAISKWGELGFTKGLAKMLIEKGIVVNGIAPGPTATGILLEKSKGELDYSRSPSKRYVTPEEVANLAVFLISDMGRMIVGETIYITGGCGTLTFDDDNYSF